MIFNVVVRSSGKKFSDFRPTIPKFFMSVNYGLIFKLSPFIFFDVRIQVIVPSFSALLSYPTRKILGNKTPILCFIFPDIFYQLLVLLRCPWSLYHIRIENLLPPVQALNVCPIVKISCNPFPIFSLNYDELTWMNGHLHHIWKLVP